MSDSLAKRPLPLQDLRIVAVEQFGAGPFGTQQLADLGAEVIKVEDPAAGGDVARYMPPYGQGEDSLFFESFNRGKKSVSLDLRDPRGRAAFEGLVRNADAVFSNLRGDGPERLGLTYETLGKVNPKIVCCSLSGFGMTGPRVSEGAYDYVVQGLAGWQSLTGAPGDPPMKSGLSLVDLAGGYVAALSIVAGVWSARRDGVGCDCDLSLFETAISLLTYVGTWVASRDHEPKRHPNSAHPSIVPFQNFPTKDGWLVIACAKDKFWDRLLKIAGREDLADDPAFATFAARHENRELVVGELERIFLTRTTDEWVGALRAAGVPVAAINDVAAALRDPQLEARGGVVELDHPTLGTVRHVASPLRVGTAPRTAERAPFRGEHTEALLTALCGYDEELLAELRESEAETGPADAERPAVG